MSVPLASPSIDDLVAFVGDEVARIYARDNKRVNGTDLADAVRHHFPNLSYTSYAKYGVSRLADVVRLAEQQGRVVRHRDVSHLEVSPTGTNPAPVLAKARFQARVDTVVPREIWEALTYSHPGQVRFLDRETNQVVAASETAPGTYANNARYVELRTIPGDIQKGWMREFVVQNPEAQAAAGAIDSELWHIAFISQLRTIRPDLVRAWRAFRAHRTIEYVKKWAAEQQVPISQVLIPAPWPPGSGRGLAVSRPSTQASGEDVQMRSAVLGVLGEMSLDELLCLSVPLRHLVRHFRPR
jgi:hypothetical protein